MFQMAISFSFDLFEAIDILDIFGEKFKVSKNLVYSYVKAVIVTKIHTLQIYLGDELVDTFDYRAHCLTHKIYLPGSSMS